ncbi:MAG: hypothetical protein E5W06_17440, partial [Mesorhizobium sp.]
SRACCPARNAAKPQGKKVGEAVAGNGRTGVRPSPKRGRSGRVRASVPEERYWRYRNVRHASGTSGTIDPPRNQRHEVWAYPVAAPAAAS